MARESNLTRRNFVRMGCCTAASFGLTAAIGRLNLIFPYAAGGATDYRALVCIFLFGGNDANNLIMPFDNAGFQNYTKLRANLALPQTTVLPHNLEDQPGIRPDGLRIAPESDELANPIHGRPGRCSRQRRHARPADHQESVHCVVHGRNRAAGKSFFSRRPAGTMADCSVHRIFPPSAPRAGPGALPTSFRH